MRHHLMQGDLALAALREFRQVVGDPVHKGELTLLDQGPHRRTGQHLGLAEQQKQRLAGRRLARRFGPRVAIAAEQRQLPVPGQGDLRARIAALLDMLADQPVEMLQRLGGKAELGGIGFGQRVGLGHGGLLASAFGSQCYMTASACGKEMQPRGSPAALVRPTQTAHSRYR